MWLVWGKWSQALGWGEWAQWLLQGWWEWEGGWGQHTSHRRAWAGRLIWASAYDLLLLTYYHRKDVLSVRSCYLRLGLVLRVTMGFCCPDINCKNNIWNISYMCLLINGCLSENTALKTPCLTFVVQNMCYKCMHMLMSAVALPPGGMCFSWNVHILLLLPYSVILNCHYADLIFYCGLFWQIMTPLC